MWLARIHAPPGGTYVSPVMKWLMFIFNILIWLISCVTIGLTIWALATKLIEGTKTVTSPLDYLFDISISLMVIACITFLLSMFGCLGALRENIVLLRIFWIILLIIVIIMVIAGVLGLALRTKFISFLKNDFGKSWIVNYYDDPDLRDVTNYFQEQFKCCGLSDEGYKDWEKNQYFACRAINSPLSGPLTCGVPYSCCNELARYGNVTGISGDPEGLENLYCGAGVMNVQNPIARRTIYIRGCVDAFDDWANNNIYIISAVVLGISIVPMIGICLAVTLVAQINDQIQGRVSPGPEMRMRTLSMRFIPHHRTTGVQRGQLSA